ncbi:hypothetical protein IKE79_01705 [Candidatus Saccharibacteria bacterium]|nr:hypothetical protein [Candidatus Saccharibacteria bacterium]
MMKVKHKAIISVGLILGGVVLARGASALTYQSEVLEEFTWGSTLGMSISNDSIAVSDLAPNTAGVSVTPLTISVNTNSGGGYTLSATVGSTSNTSSELRLNGTDTTNKFSMLAADASTVLASFTGGQWGYTTGTGNDAVYSGLTYGSDKVINKTTNKSGTQASGYPGTNSTTFGIAAKATNTQATGDYTNIINFTAVTNVVTSSVAVVADTASGTTGVSVNGGTAGTSIAAAEYSPGTILNIVATPNGSGNACYWTLDADYGTIADRNACSTTYTVGYGPVTLTAHHVSTYSVNVATAGSGVTAAYISAVGGVAVTGTSTTSGSYPEGTVLQLTSTVSSGYGVTWSGAVTGAGNLGTLGDTTSTVTTYIVGTGATQTITVTGASLQG